jgi:hypothetical protein
MDIASELDTGTKKEKLSLARRKIKVYVKRRNFVRRKFGKKGRVNWTKYQEEIRKRKKFGIGGEPDAYEDEEADID